MQVTPLKLAMIALALLALVGGSYLSQHGGDATLVLILGTVGGKLLGLIFPEVGAKKDPPSGAGTGDGASKGGSGPDDPTLRINALTARLRLGVLAVVMPVFALGMAASVAVVLPGCGSHVNWPKVAQCTEQLEQPLLTGVGNVLAGTGDVESELTEIAKTKGPDLVLCAVQQLVSDLGSAPVTARASRQATRGRAFLAKVQR